MDSWFNFWILASETTAGNPLIPIDPTSLETSDKQNGFIWPPRDVANASLRSNDEDRAAVSVAAAGMRGYTFDGMRRGDLMVWRTVKVPHAAVNWRDAKRSSLDFRCACAAAPPAEIQRTACGELCRESWRFQGKLFHGCANPDQNPRGAWCRIEREGAGGQGCMKQFGKCSRARFDYCEGECISTDETPTLCIAKGSQIHINFVNKSPFTLTLSYVPEASEHAADLRRLSEMKPEAVVGQKTYSGHHFNLASADPQVESLHVEVLQEGDIEIYLVQINGTSSLANKFAGDPSCAR
eukprot:TRINITY_DN33391_c0_g1_i2.p1 TRINITY_DN33391_c0_g1~~TRINITY_DN33391_c0_g1_i2.p1  ORF type:complete len:296 (-),score=44.43 TRINITY_DN33391_c0_g1_i2:115-1002(-)